MQHMLGIESDEPGTGTWSLRERTAEGLLLEVDFLYPDQSHTTTSAFHADSNVPGTVRTEAGTFTFNGTERGGGVVFEPAVAFADAIRALGHPIFTRELLAFALMRLPLSYIKTALACWPHERMSAIMGLHMVGATEEDMTAAIAANPNMSPTTLMMSVNAALEMQRRRP